jgi:DNA mismatch repair ATPase MutS
MQVLLGKESTSRVEESITFLYKLRYGLELTSHATQCELLCGISSEIVERAAYVAQLSREHNLHELQLRIQDELQGGCDGRDEELKSAEDMARAFVQWDIAEDQELAATYGEIQSLDPKAKLQVLLAG